LLVVGGGYIGEEMSQAMRRFGSKVTIIGRSGRLMAWASPMRKRSASRQTTWEKVLLFDLA